MQDASVTKVKIARAAMTLFVARGVRETTTKEIAKAAGVSEGAIYRHYPSKDELAWSLFENIHLRLTDLVVDAGKGDVALNQKVARIVAAFCSTADQDWLAFTYHLLNQHQMLPRFDNSQLNPVDAVKAIVKEAMARGEIEAGDAEVVTNAVLGVVIQSAIAKAYSRWEGQLSDHHAYFVKSICSILKINQPNSTILEEALQ